MTRDRIYLDWNATTPLRAEARTAMMAALDACGNPSSVHSEGRAARAIVEVARAAVGKAIGADARNVIFTSGGTEANTLALVPGLRRGKSDPAQRLIVSAIEHPSVLAGGRFAPNAIQVTAVTAAGTVDIDQLTDLLAKGPPALVSVMLANNETGAFQPIATVAEAVHAAGGVLHVDAVQALGKIAINIKELGADLLTVSAHKLGGPKGTGAMVVGDALSGLNAAIRGGGQEQGRRAGTENVAGIAGFGAAIEPALADLSAGRKRLETLRDRLETGLKAGYSGVVIFSESVARLPNTTLFAAPGMKAETAVIAFDLDGVALSSGSACSSGKVQPSHVLAAMGVPLELATGALRLSMGWQTSEADVDRCLEAWRKLLSVLVRA